MMSKASGVKSAALVPSDSFSFADDAPRTNPETQDDFGYRKFARRLADVVLNISAPDGYVIGLHGVWGSGKTTALKFVEHYINGEVPSATKSKVEVIWFSPWIFSGHQDLISAFFRILAEHLKDGGETARKARKFAHRTAKAAVDPTVKAAVTMAALAHPPDAVAIRAGGVLAKSALDQTIDAWLGDPTLQAAYNDLVVRLRKRGRRFVVFIDDIDRLQETEIRAILQMVKSVGRLPNVIYVLAYDSRIVWRALGERDARKDGEPTFTEKIIQHELELPRISWSALSRRMNVELSFVLESIRGNNRWYEIINRGLARWISNPRDIIRLSNALRFAWSPLKDEVDGGDVVAMEGLRLFNPLAFEWVRTNRELFIDTDGASYVSDENKAAQVEAFRASLPAEQQTSVIELLSLLFPSRSKLLMGEQRFGFTEAWFDTVARRGVGSPHGYDAYFSLFPSEGAVPRALIDAAAAAPDDAKVQREVLDRVKSTTNERGQSLVAEYLDQLQYRLVGPNRMASGRAMLEALVQDAPFIQAQDGATAGSFFPPYIQLHFVIREILKGWDPETAGANLLGALHDDTPAEVLASLYVWRAREAGLLPDEGAEVGAVISADALAELGKRTLTGLKVDAASGRLEAASYFWDIMTAWTTLGVQADAVGWLTQLVARSASALARVASGILATTLGSDGQNIFFYRGLSPDRTFYRPMLADLLAASEKFSNDPMLNDEARRRVQALRDGLREANREVPEPNESAPRSPRPRRRKADPS